MATVMTVMRASFLGLAAFFMVLMVRPQYTKKIGILAVVALLVIGVVVFSYEPMPAKIFISYFLGIRLYLWEHALSLWRNHFFLGIGLNHFQYTLPAYLPHDAGLTYFDAHNVYLQAASQQGLWGLLSLLLILWGYLRLWRMSPEKTSLEKILKYGSFGGFAVIFITGFFDTTLHHAQAIAFTTLAGLLWGQAGERVNKHV